MNNRKVVITGLGVVSAIGDNVAAFTQGLKNGINGISVIESMDTTGCLTDKGGEVKKTDSLNSDTYGRTLAFALKALNEAADDSGLDLSCEPNTAVILGSSLGNFEFMQASIYSRVKNGRIKTKFDASNGQRGCLSNIAAAISEKYGLNGPKLMISTACAAGTNSVGYAYELIKKGYCDIAVTGGADSLYSISLTGFSSLMSLTTGSPKPFDESRDGLTLGEGAGILILESEEHAKRRQAKVYAEITGYALCNDAYHVTSPDPEGNGAYRGMKQCIEKSGLTLEDISYINAHGTGTKANDIAEWKAIMRLFGHTGHEVYVSSNKSMFGHCLGAAGSIEAVSTVLSICLNFVPPTINTVQPIHLDSGNDCVHLVLDRCIDAEINCAISNSFAFAGNIATICFKKYA
jgi:3-oxoacyl-[acyl-carrier-protein] synthase II